MLPVTITAAARTAAVTPQGPPRTGRDAPKSGDFDALPANQTPASLIRWHDENGPGFISYYLDVRADFVCLAPIRPQTLIKGQWEWSTDPYVLEAFNTLRGPDKSNLREVQWLAARELSAIGQVGIATRAGDLHVLALDPESYQTVTPPRHAPADQAPYMAWPGVPGLKPLKWEDATRIHANPKTNTDWKIWPHTDISRIMRRTARHWDTTTPPLQPILKDLRRHHNAGRALHRATASQLILASIFWLHGLPSDAYELAEALTPGADLTKYGPLAQQVALITRAAERSLDDYNDHDQLAVAPYPLISDTKPQQIDVGKLIDPNLIPAKRDALEDAARGLNLPQSFITEGPGSGSRLLNEWRQDESARENVITDANLIADAVTPHLHTQLRAITKKHGATNIGPLHHHRTTADTQQLAPQHTPEISDLIAARQLAEIPHGTIAEALGHTPLTPQELDLWQQTTQNTQQRRQQQANQQQWDTWTTPH